jgi:hypothetical protein
MASRLSATQSQQCCQYAMMVMLEGPKAQLNKQAPL